MRETIAHRRSVRLVAAALLLAFTGVLGGCGSMSVPSWDPTDMLDFLDTKKKAPGERKPVFPEGVPGISQGVPKDLVRGSPEARAAAEANNVAPPVETQPAPPPVKRARTAAKQPAGQAPVEIAPDDVNVEDDQQPPPPRPQRSQPQTEQQANPFPTPR